MQAISKKLRKPHNLGVYPHLDPLRPTAVPELAACGGSAAADPPQTAKSPRRARPPAQSRPLTVQDRNVPSYPGFRFRYRQTFRWVVQTLSKGADMINFTCPNCGDKLSVPDSLAGETEKCIGCGNMTYVPQPGAPTSAEKKTKKKRRKPHRITEATERQRSFAQALGVHLPEGISKDDASPLIDQGVKRQDHVRHYVHGLAKKLTGQSIYDVGMSHNSVNAFVTELMQRDRLPDQIADAVIKGREESQYFLTNSNDPVYLIVESLMVSRWPTIGRRYEHHYVRYLVYCFLVIVIALALGATVCNS